jgi:hypothetical protein
MTTTAQGTWLLIAPDNTLVGYGPQLTLMAQSLGTLTMLNILSEPLTVETPWSGTLQLLIPIVPETAYLRPTTEVYATTHLVYGSNQITEKVCVSLLPSSEESLCLIVKCGHLKQGLYQIAPIMMMYAGHQSG